MPSKWKLYIPEIFFLFLLSLLPLWWMRSGGIILGHDSVFTLKTHEQVTSQFFAWNDSINFGNDWPYPRAYLPMNIVESVINRIFSFAITQRIILVSWFFLMAFSMFLFVRELFPSLKERPVRIIASLFYTINFFLFELWFIGDRPKFSLLVLLPLSFLILHKLFSHRWKLSLGITVFFFVFLLFNCAGLPPLLGSYTLAFGLVFLLFSIHEIVQFKFKGIWYVVRTSIGLGIAGFLSQAYWILPFLSFIKTSYASTVSAVGGIDGTIAWERMVSVNASIANIIRIVGSPNPSPYLSNPAFIGASMIPMFVIVSGIVFYVRDHKKLHHGMWMLGFVLLFCVGVFLSAGTHRPTGVLYEAFMRHIPGFAIFRSSYYKFMPFVIFSESILLGVGIHLFIQRIRFFTKKTTIVLCCCVTFLLLYHFPIFTANPFRFSWGFSTLVTVPSYAYEMEKIVDLLPQSSKVFLVPDLDSGYIGSRIDGYQWGYYNLEALPGFLFHRPVLSNAEGSPEAIQILYSAIKNNQTERITKSIELMGITHVLFRRDIKNSLTDNGMPIVADWEKILSNSSLFTRVFDAGAWTLYAVPSTQGVTMYPSLTVMDAPIDALSYTFSFNGNQSDAVSFASRIPSGVVNDADTRISQATCVYCKPGEFDALIKSIDIAAYRGKGSGIDQLISSAELSTYSSSSIDPGARIDMDIAFANRALVLSKTVSDAVPLYSTYMNDAFDSIKKLSPERKNAYAIRLLAFLTAQRNFVSRVPQVTDDLITSVTKLVVISEPEKGVYRYSVMMPKTNGEVEFMVEGTDRTEWNISVDGTGISDKTQFSDFSGYHQIELISKNPSTHPAFPAIFFRSSKNITTNQPKQSIQSVRVSPVEYRIIVPRSDQKQILFVPIAYHPGWVLRGGNTTHFELFGFGNGWIIPPTEQKELTLYFLPQQYLIIGFALTGVGIILAGGYSLVMSSRRKSGSLRNLK